MNLSFTVEQTESGFQYVILNEGAPWIVQPHEPSEPGFVPMSESRATELAQAFIQEHLASLAETADVPNEDGSSN
jgi:hypothetical protein